MAYRYCHEHGEWLETAEYTVDESGNTVCPEHDVSMSGYCQPSRHGDTTLNPPWTHEAEAKAAAREQGLV